MANQWYSNPAYNRENPFQANSAVIAIDEDECESWLEKEAMKPIPGPKIGQANPLPPYTTKQSRLSSHISNLMSIEIDTLRSVYSTNGCADAQVRVTVGRDGREGKGMRIGEISVYLVGFEDTGVKKMKPRTFLSKKLHIQEKSFAPTDLVHAGPIVDGTWIAKKGTVTFPVAIPFSSSPNDQYAKIKQLETTCEPEKFPSSFWNKRVGGVRYLLIGIVNYKLSDKDQTPLVHTKEIHVIEGVPYTLSSCYSNPSPYTAHLSKSESAVVSSGMFGFGRKGEVQASVELRALRVAREEEPEENEPDVGVWIGGEVGIVGLEITNTSAKKVTSFNVSLVRVTKTFKFDSVRYQPVSYHKLTTTSTNYSVPYRTATSDPMKASWAEDERRGTRRASPTSQQWCGVDPEASLKLLVDVLIPSWAVSIRKASLIDVSYHVLVQVYTGKQRKAVEVTIPITILHPASTREIPRLREPLAAEIEPAAANVSYVTIASPPAKVEVPETTPSISPRIEMDGEEVIDERALNVNFDEDSAPMHKEVIVTTKISQTTLKDEDIPIARTFSANKKVAPLKSFSRANTISNSTTRRPVISRPSPAALNSLKSLAPKPKTDAPPTVIEQTGARTLKAFSAAERNNNMDGVSTFDLDSEIDKMFGIVKMEAK